MSIALKDHSSFFPAKVSKSYDDLSAAAQSFTYVASTKQVPSLQEAKYFKSIGFSIPAKLKGSQEAVEVGLSVSVQDPTDIPVINTHLPGTDVIISASNPNSIKNQVNSINIQKITVQLVTEKGEKSSKDFNKDQITRFMNDGGGLKVFFPGKKYKISDVLVDGESVSSH